MVHIILSIYKEKSVFFKVPWESWHTEQNAEVFSRRQFSNCCCFILHHVQTSFCRLITFTSLSLIIPHSFPLFHYFTLGDSTFSHYSQLGILWVTSVSGSSNMTERSLLLIEYLMGELYPSNECLIWTKNKFLQFDSNKTYCPKPVFILWAYLGILLGILFQTEDTVFRLRVHSVLINLTVVADNNTA